MRGGGGALLSIPLTLAGDRTWLGTQTFQKRLVITGAPSASTATLELHTATGQTGNLLEIYNSSNTRVAYFDQAGNFSSTGALSFSSSQVVQGSSGIGFSVKRNVSNASDIQQWQDESGNPLLSINHAGQLTGSGGITFTGAFSLTITGAQTFAVYGDGSSLLSMTAAGVVTAQANVGTTMRLSNAQLSANRISNTANVEGIKLGNGVSQAAGWLRAANSDDVVFGFDDGTNWHPQVTYKSAGGVNVINTFSVVNGSFGFQIRSDNSNVDPGMPWLRSDGGSVFLNPKTGNYVALAYDTGNAIYLGGANGIIINNQNSSTDPGRPWIRSDGTNLIINPSGTGSIYLGFDKSSVVRLNNHIIFNQTAAPPSGTGYSAGTKLIFYDTGTDANSYTIGVDGSTLWYSTGDATGGMHKWYFGATMGAYLTRSELLLDTQNLNGGGLTISFGASGSGEGIGSNRTGGNQNGLDFFTAGISRFSISNGGNVKANGQYVLRTPVGNNYAIQSGVSSGIAADATSISVGFPTAFSGTPNVAVSPNGGITGNISFYAQSPSTSSFTLYRSTTYGSGAGTSIACTWFAMGTL